jgi:hypothetical protein
MTHFTKKSSKSRRNRFNIDINEPEDDFLPADLKVLADDTELTITPLNHLRDDEDAIDRLLINSGFESGIELEQTEEKPDAFWIDERLNDAGIETVTGPQDADISGQSVEPKKPPATSVTTAPASAFQIETFISSYLASRSDLPVSASGRAAGKEPVEIIADASSVKGMAEASVPAETESQELNSSEIKAEVTPDPVSDNTLSATNTSQTARLNQLIAEQQNINHQQQIQRDQREAKARRTTRVTYAALGFGIGALLSTAVISLMVADMKTNVSRLTGLTEIIKEDMDVLTEKISVLENNRNEAAARPQQLKRRHKK